MALDTTIGGSASDSYVTLAESDAYHLAQGRETTWVDLDPEVKEPALRKATAYLDAMYQWRGVVASSTQALKWPRRDVLVEGYVLASDAIPTKIKEACCELAFRALSADLFADVTAQHVESVKVGPIERKLSAPGNGGQVRFAVVDGLVRELVRGGSGGSVAVIRA